MMLKGLIYRAYERAQEKIDEDRPNLIILRGFSELIHTYPVPESWEHWTEAGMTDEGIYYLLAEEFQILMMDYALYLNVLDNQIQNKRMSFGNVVNDDSLEMELFTLGLAYVDGHFETSYFSEIVQKMYAMNVNFQTLDFNLFDTEERQNEYFPINYETGVGNDYDFFVDLDYHGYLHPAYHGQGIVAYYDFSLLTDTDPVQVFDQEPAYVSLGFDLNEADEMGMKLEAFLSDVFFRYLSKIDRLS